MNDHGSPLPTLGSPDEFAHQSRDHASDKVEVSCYDRDLPAGLDEEMRDLYHNIHSTIAHLGVYGGLSEVAHAYVARKQQRAVAVFLFRLEGETVRVINEGMTVDAAEVARFSQYVFSRWPCVRAITMHAVQVHGKLKLARPLQQYPCTAHILMPLPATTEEYLASLGKNTRRNIRRYMDKLTSSYPSFRFEVFDRANVSEAHVRAIIDLNRIRIMSKNMRYALDAEIGRILALVKACGTVGVMTIDGQVVGGGIGYIVGKTFYFKVTAHDPKYNAYSAGILNCYLMIGTCISRGCTAFNFMWNEYEYKHALGGRAQSLFHLVAYRSRMDLLMTPRLAADNAVKAYRHKAAALLEKEGKPEELSSGERKVLRVLGALRAGKRAAAALLKRK